MTLVRWTFQDPSNSTSYTFEINPNDGGSPAYAKNFKYTATAAPDGKTLIFEGRDAPQKLDFSGVILSQAHYNAFVTWWSKRNQVIITDDLGRSFTIIIERFTPKRKRNATTPWLHNFDVSATVVG